MPYRPSFKYTIRMSLINFLYIGDFSVCVALAIAVKRYRYILKAYRPFVFFLAAGLIFGCINIYLAQAIGTNAISGNIYVLIEFILLIWLFRNWGVFKRKDRFYKALLFIGIGIWMLDNFVLNSITNNNSIYRIAYSLFLIFVSINETNAIIVSERKSLFSNPRFIICIAIIIFFSYKAMLEAFILIDLKISNRFYWYLFLIFAFINLFANILFALAALWIPTKQRFTLPY